MDNDVRLSMDVMRPVVDPFRVLPVVLSIVSHTSAVTSRRDASPVP